jgi:hypothetical protein
MKIQHREILVVACVIASFLPIPSPVAASSPPRPASSTTAVPPSQTLFATHQPADAVPLLAQKADGFPNSQDPNEPPANPPVITNPSPNASPSPVPPPLPPFPQPSPSPSSPPPPPQR